MSDNIFVQRGLYMGMTSRPMPTASSFTGLLDTYPSAAFAFSFRKLRSAYLGSAVKIRESGGNTEADIGFDGSGNFDTAAAASFIGGNTGFIKTWYDQSGNGIDVTQSTTANQPTYNAAGFISKPAMSFDGSNDYLTKASFDLSPYISTQGTIFGVFTPDGTNSTHTLYGWDPTGGAGQRFISHVAYSTVIYFDMGDYTSSGRVSVGMPSGWYDNPHILEEYRDSSDLQGITADGVSLASATRTSDLSTASVAFQIGADGGAGTLLKGFVTEVVCWGTDLGASRSAARTAINSYYSVF